MQLYLRKGEKEGHISKFSDPMVKEHYLILPGNVEITALLSKKILVLSLGRKPNYEKIAVF